MPRGVHPFEPMKLLAGRLPSASNFVKLFNSLTGFMHSGLDFFEFSDITARKQAEKERFKL